MYVLDTVGTHGKSIQSLILWLGLLVSIVPKYLLYKYIQYLKLN